MDFPHLPFSASLPQYQKQAQDILDAYQAAGPDAIQLFRQRLPRFMDPNVPWLPLNAPTSEIQDATLQLADAQLAIARSYDFQDWSALSEFAAAASIPGSPVFQFESAVEAVIHGDAPALQSLLRENPALVHARSTRRACFDPPVHRSTLLHYLAANGVEGYRQKSPPNAVEIAAILLRAGAEPDSLASLYGGECTTMALLVSSSPPAEAGVQVPLVHTLLDFGAAIEPRGVGNWTSPLMTALVFGFTQVAEALLARGARLDNIAAAAGLGRLDKAKELLPASDAGSRHRALALAAQLGQADLVALLLDAGEDPNRYNPKGFHAHATPLHHAALAGHDAAVRLLVERGARLDLQDTIYKSTPLDWAQHGGHSEIADYLRRLGSTS